MAEKKERVILVVDDNADHLNGFRILLVRFDDARLEHARRGWVRGITGGSLQTSRTQSSRGLGLPAREHE